MRALLHELTPPIVLRWARRHLSRYGWSGDYPSWDAAVRASEGYDAPQIADQVARAARDVLEGRAAYERDGMTFTAPDVRWPLLASLLYVAARQGGRLSVLDFGGSLGSTYLQHRHYLKRLSSIHWSIVEQARFLERAAAQSFPPEVSFHPTMAESVARQAPDVILFSSVLQYLPAPYEMIAACREIGPPFVLLDRTPMQDGPRDRLTIQRVPPSIYRAIYPAWFLSRARVVDAFGGDYELVDEFEALDRANIEGSFRGMLWARRVART